MKLSEQDKQMLQELCYEYKVSYEKVIRLLDTGKQFQFKDRRTGIYDVLKDILKSEPASERS